MQTVLIVIHLMIVLALVGVVLIQRSEGGGLGIGGGSGFMSARGTANALTRTTAILATLFFITSLGLGILNRYEAVRPIFSTVFRQRAARATAFSIRSAARTARRSGSRPSQATASDRRRCAHRQQRRLQRRRSASAGGTGNSDAPAQRPRRLLRSGSDRP